MRLPATIGALGCRRGTIAVLFFVWAAWLGFPYFGLGPDSYVRIHDNSDSTLAARVSLRTASPSHFDTAWNPLPITGFDQVPVSSNADVDIWLFSVLPGWLAYGLIMFAQRLMAGYFMFRLLKDRLRIGTLASLCAGLAYACFAQSTLDAAWAGFTLFDGLSLAFLPLALWSLDDEAGWSFGRRLAIAAGLGFFLGVTSLYFLSVFVVMGVSLWLLVRGRRSIRQTMLIMALFALAWAVTEVPAVWASLLNAAQSHRADWALQNVSLRVIGGGQYSFVRGILADNKVMIAAALLGFAASRFRSRALIVALGASAAIFFAVLGYAFWMVWIQRYAGPLSGFQFDRFYLLAPFALIVSGALGLDTLATKLRGRLPLECGFRGRLWAASLTLLVLLALGPMSSVRVQMRILREMHFGSTYAAVFQRPELRGLAARASDGLPYRVVTVYAPQTFTAPKDTMWSNLFGQLPAYAWAYGLETVDGYVGMYSERYQQFWGSVTEPALQSDRIMSEYFWDWGNRLYLFVPDTGRPPPVVTNLADICDPDLLSLANTRYLISPVRLSGVGLSLVSGHGRGEPWPLYIYENTRVLPRYFIAGRTQTYRDSTGLLGALGDASLEELRSVAFVEARDAAGLDLSGSGASAGQVRLLTYRADSISLSVTTHGRSVLVCAMNYSPFWHAYVDDREAEVIPVDRTFLGVVLPGGASSVELHYQPPYAWLLPG